MLIIITHGLSGSGKSYLTDRIADKLNAICIRSDIERKKLFATATIDDIAVTQNKNRYIKSITDRTYNKLLVRAGEIIAAGNNVILDATYRDKSKRQQVYELAKTLGCEFVILDLFAPADVLRERVAQRILTGNDASDATLDVLDQQLSSSCELDEDERQHAIRFDTSQPWIEDDILDALNQFRVKS